MCLEIKEGYPPQPNGSIRYKLMKLNADGSVSGTNYAKQASSFVGDRRFADLPPGRNGSFGFYADEGIHVCVNADGPQRILDESSYGRWIIPFAKVTVRCTGFLFGGTPTWWESECALMNETWREIEILAIEPARRKAP